MEENLPDYRKKQQLLYEEHTKANELIAYGDKFLEAGRIPDALEFYQRANHIGGLETIRTQATQSGDALLFMQASKALNRVPTPDEWLTIGQAAWKAKKYSFALLAYANGGHEKLLQETEEILKTEGNAINT